MLFFIQAFLIGPEANAALQSPNFPRCDPESEALVPPQKKTQLSPQFCAKWSPHYRQFGNQCCGTLSRGNRRKSRGVCNPNRRGPYYCSEITPDQQAYVDQVSSGTMDILKIINRDMGRLGPQAQCSVGNGFLAYGRRVVPTPQNRIFIQRRERCIDFGTDPMVGMLEWLGREISRTYAAPEYSGVQLVLGDIAAPRGGYLCGPSGRRGHASHTSGQDADVGFLEVYPGKSSTLRFHRNFDPKTNWWMISKLFKNPYACVQVIFLDRQHIRSLELFAKNDPLWNKVKKWIRHIPGHKNHLHVRIGKGPGLPGCHLEQETELDLDLEFESDEEEAEMDLISSSSPGPQ